MKRFFPVLLGAALLAAPLSAQDAVGDKAAALLQKAQAAAAAGDSAKAADLARAAAELLAALDKQKGVETDRVVLATELILGADAQKAEETAPARDGASWSRRPVEPGRGFEPRQEVVIVRERAPEPDAPAAAGQLQGLGYVLAPGARARAVQDVPALSGAAPRAQQDDIGVTLRLLHAEVQALRAEVQAMRAEMQLMRAHPGARAAAAPQVFGFGQPEERNEYLFVTPDGEQHFWTTEEPHARAMFIGPDGVPVDMGDDVIEWSESNVDCEACMESEEGLCEDCREFVEQLELEGLDSRIQVQLQMPKMLHRLPPEPSQSERRIRLRQPPTLDTLFHGNSKQAGARDGSGKTYEIRLIEAPKPPAGPR